MYDSWDTCIHDVRLDQECWRCSTPVVVNTKVVEQAAEDVWNNMYVDFRMGKTTSITDKHLFIPAFISGAEWARRNS